MKEPFASRLLFPLTERRFTYGEYAAFLDGLRERTVVPMREFARGDGDLALRHDVDSLLDHALAFARLEHERGLRATYFVLHTAPYWPGDELVPSLRELQALGHEIGFHNDLVTAQRVLGLDARATLEAALTRLREGGIEVVGAAAHGSPWCHRLGFHNNYVFAGWDEPVPGFPSRDVPEKLDPREFGLEYEAYHVARDDSFSDSTFVGRRRLHPGDVALAPGRRTIVLTHPEHWDRSPRSKWERLGSKVRVRVVSARQLRAGGRRGRAASP